MNLTISSTRYESKPKTHMHVPVVTRSKYRVKPGSQNCSLAYNPEMAQPIVLNFDMNLGARLVAKRFAYAMDWKHIESSAHQTCGV